MQLHDSVFIFVKKFLKLYYVRNFYILKLSWGLHVILLSFIGSSSNTKGFVFVEPIQIAKYTFRKAQSL